MRVYVCDKFSNISEHPVVFMATEGPGMTEARGSLKAHGVTCQNTPCSRVSAVRIVRLLRTNCLCYCPSWPMKSEFQVAWNVTPCRSVNTVLTGLRVPAHVGTRIFRNVCRVVDKHNFHTLAVQIAVVPKRQ